MGFFLLRLAGSNSTEVLLLPLSYAFSPLSLSLAFSHPPLSLFTASHVLYRVPMHVNVYL